MNRLGLLLVAVGLIWFAPPMAHGADLFQGGNYAVSSVKATSEALLADLDAMLQRQFQPFSIQVNDTRAMVLYVHVETPWYLGYEVTWEEDSAIPARMGALFRALRPGYLPVAFSLEWGMTVVGRVAPDSPLTIDAEATKEAGFVYGEGLPGLKTNLTRNVGPHRVPFGLEMPGGTGLSLGIPCTGRPLAAWDILEFAQPDQMAAPEGWVPLGCLFEGKKTHLLVVDLR